MNQEDKDLLLKDLCARLPYEVKCNISRKNDNCVKSHTIDSILDCHWLSECKSDFYEIKPYLFPLSSMTEEQTEEIHNLIYQGVSESVDETKEWLKTRKENDLRPITLTYILSDKLVIDWFCKNHFDYRDLIPKGLANDATGLNIY